ncbi:MAG TPA: YafY family protein [Phototrophicaceae bacterium]|jgi:predicted DNA-binding transcriptional regulator YafY|nr:YafY family protein [Phototrophicaceae bacterium]
MYNPGTRLLTVLELLQSHGELTGRELASRLEVEVRSIRRYVTMLRDMGIPVESESGRYGYYHLRRGFRLPPLMFNNDEILAIILGLMSVRRLGLAATTGVESATAKIERVLPEELRERVRAVQGVLTLNIPTYEGAVSELVAKFSVAAYQNHQLWIAYSAHAQDRTERTVDVYGLVYNVGFWYAVCYCHLRKDLRIFRLDRVSEARLLETTFQSPLDFDALQYVLDSIASQPGAWSIEVLLMTTLENARQRIPADIALLEACQDGVILRSWADGLDWMARYLVGLGIPLRVIQPPELREALRQLANGIMQMAGDS